MRPGAVEGRILMREVINKYPRLLHGGDYNPEQWLDSPQVLEEDIRLMKEARVNCVSLGIFSCGGGRLHRQHHPVRRPAGLQIGRAHV